MRGFTFGEFINFVVPGSMVVLGVSVVYPGLGDKLGGETVTVATVGVFLILAFVVGHMVQAFGEVMGVFWWKLRKGFPTDWVRTGQVALLSESQVKALEVKWGAKLGMKATGGVREIGGESWHSIIQQMYAAVSAAGRAARLDVYTWNLLLSRGTSAAGLILTLLTAVVVLIGTILSIEIPFSWNVPTIALAATALFLVRMEQFAKRYARELFVQFIQLPEEEGGRADSLKSSG